MENTSYKFLKHFGGNIVWLSQQFLLKRIEKFQRKQEYLEKMLEKLKGNFEIILEKNYGETLKDF